LQCADFVKNMGTVCCTWGRYRMAGRIAIRDIRFPTGRTARAVQLRGVVDAATIASALQLGDPRALIVIIGGAGGMSEEETRRLRPLFVEGLAPLAAAERIAILDGGTNSGVMALAGQGASRQGLTALLIGVCPLACVSWPGRRNPRATAELEPNHSHFVLTPGRRFGDETGIAYAIVQMLSEKMPTLALVVNGGEITYDEVLRNVAQNREIIVLAGSGRAADAIAAVWESGQSGEARLAQIVARGRVVLFAVAEGPHRLARLIRERLWG